MKKLGKGVTRTVWHIGPWAVKVIGGYGGYRPEKLLRGLLANQSEWKTRKRYDVARPVWTFLYIFQAYPIGKTIPESSEDWWDHHVRVLLLSYGYSEEEAKRSSWAYFDSGYLLIDYDVAHKEPRSLMGKLYYGNQELQARKWMKLSTTNGYNPSHVVFDEARTLDYTEEDGAEDIEDVVM